MTRKGIIKAVLLILLILSGLLIARGWISGYTYRRAGDRLASKLSPDLQSKYGKELDYTLDKFWQCYEREICNRNDMTDVMYRMRELGSMPEITDMDIFEFIGFVSGLYSDRIEKHQMLEYEEFEGSGG
jgi:hypothetical protein